jgi:hypothetical protein
VSVRPGVFWINEVSAPPLRARNVDLSAVRRRLGLLEVLEEVLEEYSKPCMADMIARVLRVSQVERAFGCGWGDVVVVVVSTVLILYNNGLTC